MMFIFQWKDLYCAITERCILGHKQFHIQCVATAQPRKFHSALLLLNSKMLRSRQPGIFPSWMLIDLHSKTSTPRRRTALRDGSPEKGTIRRYGGPFCRQFAPPQRSKRTPKSLPSDSVYDVCYRTRRIVSTFWIIHAIRSPDLGGIIFDTQLYALTQGELLLLRVAVVFFFCFCSNGVGLRSQMFAEWFVSNCEADRLMKQLIFSRTSLRNDFVVHFTVEKSD